MFPYNPDLSGDGFVDYLDLILLENAWHIQVATPPVSVTGTLSGFVLDKITSQPIFGTLIRLGEFRDTRADVIGFYQFKDVIPGFYNLTAFRPPNYHNYQKTIYIGTNTVFNIELEPIVSPTITPEATETATSTLTFTPTMIPTPTIFFTQTPIPTPTRTPTHTPTPTVTKTPTPTSTPVSLIGKWSGTDGGVGDITMTITEPLQAQVWYGFNYTDSYSLSPSQVGGTFTFSGTNGDNSLTLNGTLMDLNTIEGTLESRGSIHRDSTFNLIRDTTKTK